MSMPVNRTGTPTKGLPRSRDAPGRPAGSTTPLRLTLAIGLCLNDFTATYAQATCTQARGDSHVLQIQLAKLECSPVSISVGRHVFMQDYSIVTRTGPDLRRVESVNDNLRRL